MEILEYLLTISPKMNRSKSKLPKSIEMFGQKYEVILREDLENDNSAFGLAKFKAKQILIDASLDYSQQISTLIHEIIEVANESLELGLEHKVICALEASIHQGLVSGGLVNVER